jgi:hypothetical protein
VFFGFNLHFLKKPKPGAAGPMAPLPMKQPFCQAEVVVANGFVLSRRATHEFSIFTSDVAGLDRCLASAIA